MDRASLNDTGKLEEALLGMEERKSWVVMFGLLRGLGCSEVAWAAVRWWSLCQLLPLPLFHGEHMGAACAVMIHSFQNSHRDLAFGPEKLQRTKTHVMKLVDMEKVADELHMPSLPEMIFGHNVSRIQHCSVLGIEFSYTDGLL